jgi:hypothetical protein
MFIHKKFREMMHDTNIYYEFDFEVRKDRNNRCETKCLARRGSKQCGMTYKSFGVSEMM